MKLSAADRDTLQDLTDRLVASGMSGSGVHVALAPLRLIFGRACRRSDSGITVNPTTGLLMPKAGKGRERFATPAECARLLAVLPEPDRPLWATAMYGGLRRGELMALAVQDVDLATGVIRVRHSWDMKEGIIPTKNRKERRVPIPAVLRDYLDEHLLRLGWSEGLLFGRSPVSPFDPSSVTKRAHVSWGWKLTGSPRRWVKGCDDALDRISLHECRHTFASLMIAAGVNAKALQAYMGHSSIQITFDLYGKLMPGNEDEAARLLDAYLARESERSARVDEGSGCTAATTGGGVTGTNTLAICTRSPGS